MYYIDTYRQPIPHYNRNVIAYSILISILYSFVVRAVVIRNEVTTMESQPAYLLCKTDKSEPVWWLVKTVLQPNRCQFGCYIYQYGDITHAYSTKGRYVITYDRGVYNLTIINTTLTDAGEYQCRENEGVGQSSSLTLNVLVDINNDKYQKITNYTDVVTGDNVIMQCIVNDSVTVKWLYVNYYTARHRIVESIKSDYNNYSISIRPVTNSTSIYYSLSMYNVQPNTSGWYACITDNGIELSYNTIFVVYINDIFPQSNTTITYSDTKSSVSYIVSHHHITCVITTMCIVMYRW